jgi:hypothetical protein
MKCIKTCVVFCWILSFLLVKPIDAMVPLQDTLPPPKSTQSYIERDPFTGTIICVCLAAICGLITHCTPEPYDIIPLMGTVGLTLGAIYTCVFSCEEAIRSPLPINV